MIHVKVYLKFTKLYAKKSKKKIKKIMLNAEKESLFFKFGLFFIPYQHFKKLAFFSRNSSKEIHSHQLKKKACTPKKCCQENSIQKNAISEISIPFHKTPK